MSQLALQLIAQAKAEGWKELDLGRTGLTELPEELFELEQLEILLLSNRVWDADKREWQDSISKGANNKLKGVLPNGFGKLNNLQILKIGGDYIHPYQITDISVLEKLTQLTSLYLSSNKQIKDFSVLENLNNLSTLDLSSNNISNIRFLENLNNLTSLDLSSNKQIKDFSVLENLNNLSFFNLSSNNISDIRFLENLNNLSTLYLIDNKQIKDFSVLENLNNLSSLDLSDNNISDIQVLEKLTQLTTLDLSSNNISDIRFLEKLNNLSTLYLSDNKQIKNFSPLKKLAQLSALYLRYNNISDIRFLKKLNNLSTLDLRENQISNIRFLENLNNLSTLYLGDNNIRNIRFLENLNNLNALDLRYNNISDIRFLENLTQLSSLDLSSNNISDIRFLENLTRLRSLDLSDNKFSNICFLENLTQLSSLDLSDNKQIKDFSVLEKLNNLSSLYLRSNNLSNIRFLENLTQLSSLDLSSNNISDLSPLRLLIERGVPVVWSSYTNNAINLENNLLEIPPVEIVKEGNAAILDYFKGLEEGEETVYEAKLLILGEAGAGKTTLSRKIENAQAVMPDEVIDTTTGIHIRTQLLEGGEKKENFTMYVWDFGGQEIYHATHQFFLSKRSLYILLADGRREENLDYWLQVQELFGKDSPLLIVFNQKGTIHQDVPIAEIRSFYANVKDFRKVNLKNDIDSIQKLQQQIEHHIRFLPHFERGEKVPKKWAEVRRALAKRTDNHISIQEFRAICNEAKLDTRERQDFLSDYLHDLGVLLHFQDVPALQKLVILKPEWATNAVYRVLDHTKQQNNAGHFTRQDLKQVWDCEDYLDYLDELLQLMEQFELCYPLPEDKNQFIVPQLLPNDKPVYQWDNRQNLQLVYAYDFLPKGIVTRLIVRLHGLLENQQNVWKRGAIFLYDGTRAEVIENQRDKRITIKAKGWNPRGLVSIIAKEVDEINGTFNFNERMKVKKLVPCNCQTCKSRKETGDNPNFYEYTDLVLRKERGKRTIECKYSYEDVDVRQLLEDVFVAVAEKKKALSPKEKEGLENYLDLLTQKQNAFLESLAITSDPAQKFQLNQEIAQVEKDIASTKQKLKELE